MNRRKFPAARVREGDAAAVVYGKEGCSQESSERA